MAIRAATFSDFLKERDFRCKPTDKKILGLKRIDKIDFSGIIHLSDKPSKTDMIIVKSGDLVISGINVAKGAVTVYEGKNDVTATIHYSAYEYNNEVIDINYLKWFLKSSAFTNLIKTKVPGGIKTEIKPKHLLPLEINLPDIENQREIIKRVLNVENEISVLLSEIGHQSFVLSKLRQSILQEAIQGKLVPQDPNDEPASELLKRIKADKEKLIIRGKLKKEKPLPPIKDDEVPFDLAKGWIWCRLGELILENPRNGFSPSSVEYQTNTKTLKLGATTWGIFNPLKFKYIKEYIPLDSYLWLHPGDFLIQRSNSIDYVGVTAIYTGSENEFIYPDLMMKFRPSTQLDSTYLYYVLSSLHARQYFRQNATGAQKSMPKINQSIVINTLVPLPPILEQKRICAYVMTLLEGCNGLGHQTEYNQLNIGMLMQTVLKEAFETE